MINLRNDLVVDLVQNVGDDDSIVWAAKVSTDLDLEDAPERTPGLINYLVKNKHGSPFEHNSMTFRIEAPIFTFREFHRHRIGWSYNEISARYTSLAPDFYFYPDERPLIQSGSSAHPKLSAGSKILTKIVNGILRGSYAASWKAYQLLIEHGVALEVARAVLPVGIYSKMYATANARSIMAFLSLRTESDLAAYPSKPQWEIARVADAIEEQFKAQFPLTWQAFNDNGRVAP